jgi:hypothetical protein
MSKPSDDRINHIRKIIIEYFIDGFKNLSISHFEDNHKWFYGKSVFSTNKDLGLTKPEIIFILMGSNKKFPHWGNLTKEESAFTEISKIYQSIIEKTFEGYTATIEFTERTHYDGNFKAYVEFKERINSDDEAIVKKIVSNEAKKPVSNEASNSYANAVKAPATEIKKPKEVVPRIIDDIITQAPPSSPSIDRLFKPMTPIHNIDDNMTRKNEEIENLKKQIEKMSMEISILRSIINDNIKCESKSSTPKSISRVASEALIHTAVDELDNGQNWDDAMHPPTPKKSTTPVDTSS